MWQYGIIIRQLLKNGYIFTVLYLFAFKLIIILFLRSLSLSLSPVSSGKVGLHCPLC